jgi:hypothetical protein
MAILQQSLFLSFLLGAKACVHWERMFKVICRTVILYSWMPTPSKDPSMRAWRSLQAFPFHLYEMLRVHGKFL